MTGSIPIKTPEEIEAMREGGAILKETLDEMGKAVRPGISTYELDQLAEEIITSHSGAKPGFKGYRGFPGTLCVSVNDEVVHGIPSPDRILQDGDIIGIDCGVLYKDLYTDACRTFLVGDVDPDIQHFVKTTKKALNQAVKVVKPGNTIGDISAVIQKTIEQQGYSPVVECTGHGVGKNLHEPPEILNVGQKGTGPTIKPGMVLAIEPIANMGSGQVVTADDRWTVLSADGSPSAHFEHTVLVTESGCEVIV
ncbi:type I methionyl aminopeptidase [Patescibacteria group bacterium]|nr:type I methionyl aminopeptidase [Patescibacteria group bacterium]MBU1683475.1 type I methionyl aminopeptidase [Patescibacteria group bacterium]MBU1935584.1 type I methionyl aminopeptidase [Patescibacteria group bacterium]